MSQSNSRFFSVMVVGNDPQKIMEKYGSDFKVEPYVKYKYLDAKKYQNGALNALKKILENSDKIGMKANLKEALDEHLKELSKLTPFEYYRQLTNGLYYNENGDALSDENPNAKWVTCNVGRNFSLPLILKNGEEAYSALSKDVDWESMNNPNKKLYESAWEIVVDGREPNDDEERIIYNSMKDKKSYFGNFKSKEDYVAYSTSYWNYAFVDKDNWIDVDSYEGSEIEWVKNFYERFIKNIEPNELVTIYECSVNNG